MLEMFKGLMDGWHGDEIECHGNCGRCDKCEAMEEHKSEDEQDRLSYEENR